jgi:hypothetical protein
MVEAVAPNKDWGEGNYRELAKQLFDRGRDLVQFAKNTPGLSKMPS